MCYYENVTVNGENIYRPFSEFSEKSGIFRILTVFSRSTKKTKEARTIPVRV
jgi:hypothetical protein